MTVSFKKIMKTEFKTELKFLAGVTQKRDVKAYFH